MIPSIGIIGGKGRMGKLFADFFAEHRLKVLISDQDTKLTNHDLARQADIVIVAVPIDKTVQVIKEVLPYVKKDAAIMDLTSIKEIPIKTMLKGNCEVLGMHPMFGNSNPIPGQTIIVTPTKKSGKWSRWTIDFLKKNRVTIKTLSPQEHDRVMNIAQGLIHFAEIVFADSLRRLKIPVKELLQFTGKASELKVQLAARILDQDPSLYGNIQIQNPQRLRSLKELLKSTKDLFKIVQKQDLKGFDKYFLENKKFLGNYTKEAYLESSYLIDKLLELRKVDTKKTKQQTPTLKHIAILGPQNTFSDLAATKYLSKFKSNPSARHELTKKVHEPLQPYFTREIDEVFELVENKKVAFGFVPIENKLHGSVRETLDGLFNTKVTILDEFKLPIHHCLITLKSATPQNIKSIISHSQALNQCKKYLQKHFSKANREAIFSTGMAVEKLLSSKDKSIAVIAPEIAAQNPHLKILAKNIEDQKDNSTTFILICHGSLEISNSSSLRLQSRPHNKTSIAFHFDQDAPGTLFTIFKDFADAKINLTKIESRPTKSAFGDYIFYLDFKGKINDANVKKVLKLVEQKVARLKILGSY